jgi:hypothetical protein
MPLMRLALLAMFLVARALPAQAQVSAMDGTRWNGLDESVKVGYAVGFIQGVTFCRIADYRRLCKRRLGRDSDGQGASYVQRLRCPPVFSTGRQTNH